MGDMCEVIQVISRDNILVDFSPNKLLKNNKGNYILGLSAISR